MAERAHELPEPEPVAAPVASPSPATTPLARSPRIEHVPPDRVPGLEDLRMALELAVAMGADAGAPG